MNYTSSSTLIYLHTSSLSSEIRRHPGDWMLVPGLQHTIISVTDLMSLMCTPRPLSSKAFAHCALYCCSVAYFCACKSPHDWSHFYDIIFVIATPSQLWYGVKENNRQVIIWWNIPEFQWVHQHHGLMIIITLTLRVCDHLVSKWLCKQLTCIRSWLHPSTDFHL